MAERLNLELHEMPSKDHIHKFTSRYPKIFPESEFPRVSKREIRPRESLTLNFIAVQELLTVKTGEGMFHELVTPGQPWAEHREM